MPSSTFFLNPWVIINPNVNKHIAHVENDKCSYIHIHSINSYQNCLQLPKIIDGKNYIFYVSHKVSNKGITEM